MGDTPEILFLCVHNAGRSQMAAALARRLGGERVRVRTAGSAPGECLHPVVVAAMHEIGVDLGSHVPRMLTDDDLRAADVVVTMGCGETCPVVPGKAYRDWDVPDPKDLPIEDVRAIRDQIHRKVSLLLAEFGIRAD